MFQKKLNSIIFEIFKKQLSNIFEINIIHENIRLPNDVSRQTVFAFHITSSANRPTSKHDNKYQVKINPLILTLCKVISDFTQKIIPKESNYGSILPKRQFFVRFYILCFIKFPVSCMLTFNLIKFVMLRKCFEGKKTKSISELKEQTNNKTLHQNVNIK